uniref:RAVE complex protein Rav1 C-terminal domain-containing protein n=1 Tax=Eptatretus burgeri TaxID=7764 RepID=A0A8C4N4T9_EPTBU
MLFMHVFAEDLVVPRWQHKATVGDAAETHGLNMASQFSEKFYLVSIEQEAGGRAMLHMWKLHLCSVQALSGNIPQSPHEGQPRVIGSLPPSASSVNLQTASRLTLTSNLLISTELSLPPTISVLHATPAAGHMSSSTIYPACLAPYLFATTCSDNSVRFWRCVAFQSECSTQVTAYQWEEWPLFAEGSLSSSVSLSGWPVALCCSYPGCFAVACSAPWEIGPSGLREYPTDYVEIEAVPPLPLYSLLAVHGLETPSSHSLLNQNPVSDSLSGLRSTQHSDKDQYEELLHVTDSAADDDDFMIEQQNSPPKTVDLRAFSPTYFGKEQADLLAAHLVHASLPGLTRLEQMYLLGLADRLGRIDAESSSRSLGIDSCGVRFLLAVRLRSFLLTTLPPAPRSQLLLHGLATCHFAWAFHSESQEELLEQATSERQEQYRWPELRALGIGWWLRNNTMLRTCIEKMAKVMFQDNGNPLDAALFYLAMKKKAVLWGLFRSKGELKMTEFFRNDFSEERWRRAALKNAFALLGKQRFEQAAAFFLLAGSLKDAVEVCVERLEDLQLALVICRLYEADPDAGSSLYRTTLALYVLRKCERCDVKAQKHNDPFLRSLAFWIVGDYSGALATLLDQPDYKSDRGSGTAYLSSSCNPAIFSFYSFLRSHPLIQRQRLAAGQQQSKGISLRERNLYFSTAHTYFKAGCPLLVLEVLTRMPPIAVTYGAADETKHQTKEKTEFLDRRPDRDSSRSLDMANAIDWGTNSAQSDSDSLELSWGSENSDDDEGLTMKNLDQAKDAVTKREPDANLGKAKSILLPGQILQTDIMAEQLKFRACLKLLVTELRTLAMGYEVGYPLFV